jgi:hypothetical protein
MRQKRPAEEKKKRSRQETGRERDREITRGGEKREPLGFVSPERGKRGTEVGGV